ncbi:hypothetical protein A5875_001094, partial [Enterococcus sp. 3H8_DIV0648]
MSLIFVPYIIPLSRLVFSLEVFSKLFLTILTAKSGT